MSPAPGVAFSAAACSSFSVSSRSLRKQRSGMASHGCSRGVVPRTRRAFIRGRPPRGSPAVAWTAESTHAEEIRGYTERLTSVASGRGCGAPGPGGTSRGGSPKAAWAWLGEVVGVGRPVGAAPAANVGTACRPVLLGRGTRTSAGFPCKLLPGPLQVCAAGAITCPFAHVLLLWKLGLVLPKWVPAVGDLRASSAFICRTPRTPGGVKTSLELR